MRGINWPAGFDACASKWSVRVLICVWSRMSCCKWLKLSLEFNFAVRHTSGHTEPATWRYDVTMVQSTRAIIIDAFANKFNCSKHDETMASGCQATVRTCNDYSGSKVRSFSSRCARHDIISLLTVITKVLVECIIEPAMSYAPRACQILMEQSKENAEIGRLFCRTGNIYL